MPLFGFDNALVCTTPIQFANDQSRDQDCYWLPAPRQSTVTQTARYRWSPSPLTTQHYYSRFHSPPSLPRTPPRHACTSCCWPIPGTLLYKGLHQQGTTPRQTSPCTPALWRAAQLLADPRTVGRPVGGQVAISCRLWPAVSCSIRNRSSQGIRLCWHQRFHTAAPSGHTPQWEFLL